MPRLTPPSPRSGFIEPCLPSSAERPPAGPDWIHEIKHDGYRLMARRDPTGIRLLTRNGHDWAPRYPLIVEAVDRLKVRSCLIDGEAVACDKNGLLAHDGESVFRHACKMGLEGIVSKRLGSRYRSGRSKDWLKFKNPDAPAVKREAEEEWPKEKWRTVLALTSDSSAAAA